jgi:hypothetical protein
MATPRAQRDEPGVGRKRFEYPHGTPYGRRPPARGEAGVSLLAETPVVPTPYSGETDGVLSATASRHPAIMANELPARRRGWFPVTQRRGHPVGATGDHATVRAWARRWAKERPWGS